MLLGAGGAYGFLAKRLNGKDAEIARLTAEQKGLRDAHSHIHSEWQATQRENERIRSLLVSEALKIAEREGLENNYEPAHQAVKRWLDSESESLSRIFIWRVKWVLAHGAGELRLMSLLVAQAFARSAVALWPDNSNAQGLLSDVTGMLDESARPWPSLRDALSGFDERAKQSSYKHADIDAADRAEQEAWRCYHAARWYVGLSLVEWILVLRRHNQGKNHPDVLRSTYLYAGILAKLGRSAEALEIAQAVVDAQARHPSLGSDNPATLRSRYEVAGILNSLGRPGEALVIAEHVAGAQAAHPLLGPDHPETLNSQNLLANILEGLGKREALVIAQELLERESRHPSLGPDHPQTLNTLYRVAVMLTLLGRLEEALLSARRLAEMRARNSSFGPSHPSTLDAWHLEANILISMGRCEEGLKLAEKVLQTRIEHIR